MKPYDVTIKAVVCKTMRIEAPDAFQAENIAHAIFNVLTDRHDRTYVQSTVSVEDAE